MIDFQSSPLERSGRRIGFTCALSALEESLADKDQEVIIVECGCLRTPTEVGRRDDGWSTLVFAWWLSVYHPTRGRLISIDCDQSHLDAARYVCEGEHMDNVTYVHSDSVKHLSNWDSGTISLLYLDSLDWGGKDSDGEVYQLREIEAAYPHLASPSIVLMDDLMRAQYRCEPHNSWEFDGKCAYSAQFLVDRVISPRFIGSRMICFYVP